MKKMKISQRRNNSRNIRRAVRQPSLYSRTEEPAPKPFSFRWIIIFVILLLITGIIFLVFISDVFRVNNVVFSPTKYISREELEKTKNNNQTLFDNNIISFGFFGLAGKLEKVTGVSKISVIRKSNHDIYVNIKEEYPLLVWQTMNKKYLVNNDGIIWANFEDKYASVPIIIDTKNVPVELNSKVIPGTFISFITELQNNFPKKTANTIIKMEVLDIISDLRVTTKAGWCVYFDTSRTAGNQIISLGRVLTEVAAKKQPLEYVDLRVRDRIFYK
ncbi:MAG: hypothetical protein WCP14_01800 [bacterium]